MSLPHALLTSLVERPSSGLELARRFDGSIGFFWNATHQQIYRELARLEEADWVRSSPVEDGRGRKRIYKVLAAGKKELRRWVEASSDPRPLRDEMMVRLRAEAAVGPTKLGRDLERRVELHRQKLAMYRAIEARDFSGRVASRSQQLQHLVLRTGILHETMYIEITLGALAILDRR
ncbi:MAG: PadR family transcriptional regulator [Myxococcales bacterium]|nr:PadR family transcriptional regulator [Myxococcales bacterium]